MSKKIIYLFVSYLIVSPHMVAWAFHVEKNGKKATDCSAHLVDNCNRCGDQGLTCFDKQGPDGNWKVCWPATTPINCPASVPKSVKKSSEINKINRPSVTQSLTRKDGSSSSILSYFLKLFGLR